MTPPTPPLASADRRNDATVTTATVATIQENESISPPTSPQSSAEPPLKLYKSRRFKGYLTIVLASVINYNAAILSDQPVLVTTVPSSPTQKGYALSVALISSILTGCLVVIHLDRWSPFQKTWRKYFAPASKLEMGIILFLCIWWILATILQTTVRGVAGDGKKQYNLYYSTWVCLWTSLWILERKLVDWGYPTLRQFVNSWPSRAPGWIAIFGSDFFLVFWYVDLFVNTKQNPERVHENLRPFYESIPKSQFQWLLFVASFTLLPSGGFIALELLRSSPSDKQSQIESNNVQRVLEGCCLGLLTLCWIPSVVVATTPGGFASWVGNAYFFTWATTVATMETVLWFIHDSRQAVHRALQEKEREYRQHQLQVLERSSAMAQQRPREGGDDHSSSSSNNNNDNSNDNAGSSVRDEYSEEHIDYDEEDESIQIEGVLENSSLPQFRREFEESQDDASIQREMQLLETDPDQYFDDLRDILE